MPPPPVPSPSQPPHKAQTRSAAPAFRGSEQSHAPQSALRTPSLGARGAHTAPPQRRSVTQGPNSARFLKTPLPAPAEAGLCLSSTWGWGHHTAPTQTPPAPEQQGQRCPGPRNCSASGLLPGTLKSFFLHPQHPKTPTTLFPAPPCSPKTPFPVHPHDTETPIPCTPHNPKAPSPHASHGLKAPIP